MSLKKLLQKGKKKKTLQKSCITNYAALNNTSNRAGITTDQNVIITGENHYHYINENDK